MTLLDLYGIYNGVYDQVVYIWAYSKVKILS